MIYIILQKNFLKPRIQSFRGLDYSIIVHTSNFSYNPPMKPSVKKGLGFGLTSGIITTLGLIVGPHSGTHSQTVIISGILVIAIADAMSDALGIHISEESAEKHPHKEVWEATIATFASKFFFALTFIIPILLLELTTAIIVSIAWGLLMIALFSYYISKKFSVILEHVLIAVIVIIITHFVGDLVASLA